MKRSNLKRYLTILASILLGIFLFRKANTAPTAQALSDEALKIAVAKMRLRQPSEPAGQRAVSSKLVSLGRKLFFDQTFSSNGKVSCATCHDPNKSFTDGLVTATGIAATSMNTPTLVNSYFGQWFFWNGRSDSLEAQALGPLENAKEHGFTRTGVARVLKDKYKLEYEALFGVFPSDLPLDSDLGLPAPVPSPVSQEVAAYALATLGSQEFQKSVLKTAQRQTKQPVEILRAMTAGSPAPSTPFDQLPDLKKTRINTIFANFGRAIAAFERTIKTTDAPFDLFADALSRTGSLDASKVDGFGETQLRGLMLFTGRGNCTFCHQGSHFTDQQFHNVGLMAAGPAAIDLGRSQGMLMARDSDFSCRGGYLRQSPPGESCLELEFLETESAEAVGAFKTPTLRNLRDTLPYGHDGRFQKLSDVLRHYNLLTPPPAVGHVEELLRPLNFNERELQDLEDFLISLSSSVTFFRGE
jgi:cytochrome c peroxidase